MCPLVENMLYLTTPLNTVGAPSTQLSHCLLLRAYIFPATKFSKYDIRGTWNIDISWLSFDPDTDEEVSTKWVVSTHIIFTNDNISKKIKKAVPKNSMRSLFFITWSNDFWPTMLRKNRDHRYLADKRVFCLSIILQVLVSCIWWRLGAGMLR